MIDDLLKYLFNRLILVPSFFAIESRKVIGKKLKLIVFAVEANIIYLF